MKYIYFQADLYNNYKVCPKRMSKIDFLLKHNGTNGKGDVLFMVTWKTKSIYSLIYPCCIPFKKQHFH